MDFFHNLLGGINVWQIIRYPRFVCFTYNLILSRLLLVCYWQCVQRQLLGCNEARTKSTGSRSNSFKNNAKLKRLVTERTSIILLVKLKFIFVDHNVMPLVVTSSSSSVTSHQSEQPSLRLSIATVTTSAVSVAKVVPLVVSLCA